MASYGRGRQTSYQGRDNSPGGGRGSPFQSPGHTRPFTRRGVGRGTAREKTAASMVDTSPKLKRAKVDVLSGPSIETLARVAAIRESSERYGEGGSGSESEEEEDLETSELLSNTLKMYIRDLGPSGGDNVEVGELLSGSLFLATGSCLVCLSVIRRAEPVWSCIQCFCLFHLQCIQQWARDGVKQQTILSPDLFPGQDICWSCPKCRRDYRQSEFPEKYHCFCGKQVDPSVDPWLIPHSCGEICDKPLQPECGHMCVSLCHPGSCPPCPKTTHVTCHCGRSHPVVKRCGVRGWSCGRVCGRVLSCGLHTCETRCHEGACQPCDEVVDQWCLCGRESRPRSCAAPEWQCTQVCGKLLACGHHHCDKVCHSGSCGGCPRSGVRTCPCGKTKHTLPCTEDIPTCGDTCSKELPCGRHQCMRQCHYGDCEKCLQMAVKRCRCGKKEKSVACSTDYLCEAKCLRMRQCGRHQCKRKCCDGNCPPCEQVCGRGLGCKNHKCVAPCHGGRCYPCVLTVNVTCNCGSSKLLVPCGREKASKPPKCRELCRNPTLCHHPERKVHHCHFGPCPPCRQRCAKPLPCGHTCSFPCHSEPKLPPRPPGVAPWVKMENVQRIVQPCPPCKEPVSKACKGKHEVSNFACCEVREYSCGRQCQRRLACGNHTCQRGCHTIINPPGDKQAGDDCLQCQRECQNPRPTGCTHPCTLPCHTGDCPTCEVLAKLRCHCGTMNLFVKCCEWTAASESRRTELQTCTSQCTKILACGHRCPLDCHGGDCSKPSECKRKVSLRCSCRRIKKEMKCCERNQKMPECDSECKRIQREREEEHRREAETKRALEEREKQEREEELLRQLRPRRRKPRPKVEEEDEELSFYQRHQTAIWVTGVLASVVGTVGIAVTLLSVGFEMNT